jgi:hypothetical protein
MLARLILVPVQRFEQLRGGEHARVCGVRVRRFPLLFVVAVVEGPAVFEDQHCADVAGGVTGELPAQLLGLADALGGRPFAAVALGGRLCGEPREVAAGGPVEL